MTDSISTDVAKLLTHVEASIREQTVSKISQYLAAREKQQGKLDDLELQKLWKALYYCFWLTDKQVNQQEMGKVLAELGTKSFSNEYNVHRYFVNFFVTMRSEWTKIDYLRLDKYYSLVRRMLNEWLAFLKSTKWRMSSLEQFSLCFREDVLLPFQADGLRMHLSFCYLPELAKLGGCKLNDSTLRELLSPFFCVLVDPPSEIMFQNTIKEVFEGLDKEYDGGARFSTLDRVQFGKSLFEIATEVESMKPTHRKQLYALASKTFGYSDKKRAALASAAPVASKKAKVVEEKQAEDSDNEEEKAEAAQQQQVGGKKKLVTGKVVNLPKKTITAEEMEEEKYEPRAETEEEEQAPETPKSSTKKAKKQGTTPASVKSNKKSAPAAVAAVPPAKEEEPVAAAQPKKKVSFSHFETQNIKQITKRMQDTPKKPAAEFAKPTKSLIRPSKWPSDANKSKKSSKA